MTLRGRTLQWVLVAALGVVVVWGIVVGTDPGDPAMRVAELVACPVCDGESVAASQTDIARSMLERIRTMQTEGATDDEIVDWFVARYGAEIDLRTPDDLGGLLLRSVPLLVVIVGVGLVVWLMRRPDAIPGETSTTPMPVARRTVFVLGGVAVGLVAVAFLLGGYLAPRQPGTPVSGELIAPVDLASISDEVLAATIAGFADDPDVPPAQLNGMRLALAERYFTAGDYRAAAEVFREVLDGEPTPLQASEALGRLGWVLWVNDEPAAAEEAFTRAIDLADGNGEVRYLYSVMLVDQGRGTEAIPYLESLLGDTSVPGAVAADIAALLEEARS